MDLASYYYYGSFSILRTAKSISISKGALQRRKKETNAFHNVVFPEVLAAKIMDKKARTRFRLHTNCSFF